MSGMNFYSNWSRFAARATTDSTASPLHFPPHNIRDEVDEMNAEEQLRDRIQRMRDALKLARDYIQHSASGGIGHVGDERPVIDKINDALEN